MIVMVAVIDQRRDDHRTDHVGHSGGEVYCGSLGAGLWSDFAVSDLVMEAGAWRGVAWTATCDSRLTAGSVKKISHCGTGVDRVAWTGMDDLWLSDSALTLSRKSLKAARTTLTRPAGTGFLRVGKS